MTAYSAAPSIPPRNALIAPAQQGTAPSQPAPRAPANVSGLLASAIGHAAVLSDTPAKWASTITMLKQNGVDPHGFEDFEKGRPAAISAAGAQAPQEEAD